MVRRKNPILAQAHTHTQKKIFYGKFCAKKCYFHFPKVFLITFSEGNGRAQVEENNSNHTLVCDDDAHKVVLCTRSHFFCTRWVKEIDLKDTPHNKGKKPPHKKMLKTSCG